MNRKTETTQIEVYTYKLNTKIYKISNILDNQSTNVGVEKYTVAKSNHSLLLGIVLCQYLVVFQRGQISNYVEFTFGIREKVCILCTLVLCFRTGMSLNVFRCLRSKFSNLNFLRRRIGNVIISITIANPRYS